MCLATFWAIFSQTHRDTLAEAVKKRNPWFLRSDSFGFFESAEICHA
jgi:hypothetical protein